MKFKILAFIKKLRFFKYISGNPNSHVFSLADVMPWVRVQAVETVEGCTHEVSAAEMHVESIGLFHIIVCITASKIILCLLYHRVI